LLAGLADVGFLEKAVIRTHIYYPLAELNHAEIPTNRTFSYLLPIWSVYIYTEQIGGKQETSREKTEKQNKMKSVHTSKSKKIPIKSISLHRK